MASSRTVPKAVLRWIRGKDKAIDYAIQGSPAHAGIDPHRLPSPPPGHRFPRTRGDRPAVGASDGPARMVPPHTRG